jgi:periplasmic divalent cation tolerance protein
LNISNDIVLFVLITVPDHETGIRIADTLISQRLAACVNVIPKITSVYRWNNEIQHDLEELLIIKSTRSCFPALEKAVVTIHPYEVPEIIALNIDSGSEKYLGWVLSETQPQTAKQ